MAIAFNLIDELFIPCRTAAGTELHSLRVALAEAHTIAEIADPSPLTTFALYRFLLVIVHCSLEPKDWEEGRLPMDKIDVYLEKNRSRFDLFDKERPFLQLSLASRTALLNAKRKKTEEKKGAKPGVASSEAKGNRKSKPKDFEYMAPSYLFAELPTGSNINHTRHTYDETVGLCPVCCAHGLLRLAPFCPDGGAGKFASVNATPPAYVLPVGTTLFHTLQMNARCLLPRTDYPSWEVDKYDEKRSIGIAEGFTWQPRAVWLNPPGTIAGNCWQCGNFGPLTRNMVFEAGRPTSVKKAKGEKGKRTPLPRIAAWRDPHVCYVAPAQGQKQEESPLVAQEPSSKSPEYRAGRWVLSFWRRAFAALLQSDDKAGCRAMKSAAADAPTLRLELFVPVLRAGQDKTFLNRADAWVIPQLDERTRTTLLGELEWLEKGLEKCHLDGDELKKSSAKKPAVKEVKPVLSQIAEFERRAEGRFRILLARSGEGIDDWRQAVRTDVLELTRPADTPGQALADAHAVRIVGEAVEKAFALLDGPPRTWATPRVGRQLSETNAEERFIRNLHRLGARERGALKTAGVRPTAADVAAHDAFTAVFWPVRNSRLPRETCRLFAGMYFWHPASLEPVAALRGPDLGGALARAAHGKPDAHARAERLLRQLVAAPRSDLPPLLWEAVRALATARITPGWPRLLADLRDWHRTDRAETVQARWAASFLTPRC